jgi:aspartate carbamoyltransferase regulatory subunit
MKMEQDEISTISNKCNRKVSQKEKHKQSEINACLRCGGDKCVCDREKQHTTKITTKSLINSL